MLRLAQRGSRQDIRHAVGEVALAQVVEAAEAAVPGALVPDLSIARGLDYYTGTVFEVIAGYDPADLVTAQALEHKVDRYSDHLRADGLVGKRIGVVRQITDSETIDQGVLARFDEALEALRRLVRRCGELPEAVLHADLFRDNVMFDGHQLTGLIDFYNAASGPTLYDLAICANDWCVDEQSRLDPHRAAALLSAYAEVRPFTQHEVACWPDMLRVAALRFWLSREIAARSHADQPGVLIKDPKHFMRVLEGHRRVSVRLPLATR